MQIVTLRDSLHEVSDRKEDNDHVSIHLPNNFCTKTTRGKKDTLKVTAAQSEYYKQKAHYENMPIEIY